MSTRQRSLSWKKFSCAKQTDRVQVIETNLERLHTIVSSDREPRRDSISPAMLVACLAKALESLRALGRIVLEQLPMSAQQDMAVDIASLTNRMQRLTCKAATARQPARRLMHLMPQLYDLLTVLQDLFRRVECLKRRERLQVRVVRGCVSRERYYEVIETTSTSRTEVEVGVQHQADEQHVCLLWSDQRHLNTILSMQTVSCNSGPLGCNDKRQINVAKAGLIPLSPTEQLDTPITELSDCHTSTRSLVNECLSPVHSVLGHSVSGCSVGGGSCRACILDDECSEQALICQHESGCWSPLPAIRSESSTSNCSEAAPPPSTVSVTSLPVLSGLHRNLAPISITNCGDDNDDDDCGYLNRHWIYDCIEDNDSSGGSSKASVTFFSTCSGQPSTAIYPRISIRTVTAAGRTSQ